MAVNASPPPDPRTVLASERTSLAQFRTQRALDRTTLAWIRTTLTMASFGFGMVGFFRGLRAQSPNAANVRLHEGAIQFGTGLIVLGTIAMALAGMSHVGALRRMRRGEELALTGWSLSITLGFLLTILFAIGLWSLFSVR